MHSFYDRVTSGANRIVPPTVAIAVAIAIAIVGCGSSNHQAATVAATAPTVTSPTPTSPTQTTPAASTPKQSPPARKPPLRPPPPLTGRVIVIDPGHNGGNGRAPSVVNQLVPAGRGQTKACNTTGTATDSGYPEAEFNWDVSLRLQQLLNSQGAQVVLTRHSDSGIGPCVNIRAAIGNAVHADAVIAVHADGGPANGRGFDVIYPPDSGSTAAIFAKSLLLAHAVHTALIHAAFLPPATYVGHGGYDQRSDLAGLNLSTQPAIFVELGNMRNSTDAAIQTTQRGRQTLARALDRGLIAFLTANQ